jgi:hypothetical protein
MERTILAQVSPKRTAQAKAFSTSCGATPWGHPLFFVCVAKKGVAGALVWKYGKHRSYSAQKWCKMSDFADVWQPKGLADSRREDAL